MSDEEKIKEIASHLALAMCIDGECKHVKPVIMQHEGRVLAGSLFELNDAKRGRFYMSLLNELPNL